MGQQLQPEDLKFKYSSYDDMLKDMQPDHKNELIQRLREGVPQLLDDIQKKDTSLNFDVEQLVGFLAQTVTEKLKEFNDMDSMRVWLKFMFSLLEPYHEDKPREERPFYIPPQGADLLVDIILKKNKFGQIIFDERTTAIDQFFENDIFKQLVEEADKYSEDLKVDDNAPIQQRYDYNLKRLNKMMEGLFYDRVD